MRKQAKYTYQKINKDTSKSKHSNTLYWDARNIRVMSNKEFGAITNEKGNDLILTLPEITTDPTTKLLEQKGVAFPINNLSIIHSEKIDERVVLFTTNSTSEVEGVEAIWLLEEVSKDNFDIQLLFLDKLGFNIDTHIESVGISESDEAQKVYWVDGVNEIRFLNIINDNLNKEVSEISVSPRATLLDPSVTGYSDGGSHKAGVVQYAYNLYNQYGAETKVSGLSELVALQNDDKGNPLDAAIDKSPIVSIDSIPENFEYIKIYSIYYSSLNQTPRIALIYENENNSTELEITDTNDIIREISLNEFNIISNSTIIPKHITNKDGHLFFGDYKIKKFDVDYDARAFGFSLSGGIYANAFQHESDKYNTVTVVGDSDRTFNTFLDTIPEDHDVIPTNTATNFIFGTLVQGYSGKNTKVTISYVDNDLDIPDTSSLNTSLKRGETYRVGIVFYNDKDEESFVKWITDVKIPAAGDTGYENIISGNNARLARLSVEVNNIPEGAKSYRIVRVKKLEKDKTIKAQGFVNDTIYYKDDSFTINENTVNGAPNKLLPDYIQRTFRNVQDNPKISLLNTTIADKIFDKPVRFQKGRFQGLGATFNNDNVIGNNLGIVEDGTLQTLEGEVTGALGNILKYVATSIDSLAFYSNDLLYKDININNDFKIRGIGFAENNRSVSTVDFFAKPDTFGSLGVRDTTPSFRRSIPDNFDEIAKRLTFSSDTENKSDIIKNETYLWSSDTQEYNFINYEDLSPNDFSRLRRLHSFINPLRPVFTFYIVGDTELEVNVWEYRKSFAKKYFYNIKPFPNTLNISNIDATLETIDQNTKGYLLSNVLLPTDIFDVNSPATTKVSLTYDSSIDFLNTKSDSNKHILFNSLDLYDNLASAFANYPTNEVDNKDYIALVEFYNDNITQYGGNTYAARQRNTYIPFSKKIKSDTSVVNSVYGDTYIQKIDLVRTFFPSNIDTDTEHLLSESINYVSETYINNDLRYDLSKEDLGKFDFNIDNNFLYNEVYSQENDLIKSLSKPFNFTTQETFRSEVVASPKKQLGELIDNWTRISINDRITLDTKYGEITAFSKLNDVLYAFQRNAIAYLAVNPRVQLQANDNIPIQLGSGKLIERYQYISTESGTLHPRSVESTEAGIFYFDTLNYSINKLAGQKEEISLTKGLYNYIKDFTIQEYDNLKGTNKVITHYDNLREEVYFTFNIDSGFTVAYNLLSDGFVSFYDFKPNVYFKINNNMYTVPSDNTAWKHNSNTYNTFYGQYYPSSITILFNEDSDYEKIMDNLAYISNVKENNVDKVNVTFNSIKVDNAYQTTGIKPLTIGDNIKRKFREFNLTIPREENTRNRIRGEYGLIKLDFDYPANNYELVLNDIIVSYTIN